MMQMLSTILLLAVTSVTQSESETRWRTFDEVPFELRSYRIGGSSLYRADWDVDIDTGSGGATYTIDEIENDEAMIGIVLGLDMGRIDFEIAFHPDRDFEGDGVELTPVPGPASFSGDMRLLRLIAGFRAVGLSVGADAEEPDFDVWLRPTIELSWTEITVTDAVGSGTTVLEDDEDAWTWGIGLTISARYTADDLQIGLEVGWVLAGGRIGGELDIESRSEAMIALSLSFAIGEEYTPQ
jgi:hypothetical protein